MALTIRGLAFNPDAETTFLESTILNKAGWDPPVGPHRRESIAHRQGYLSRLQNLLNPFP
jgi:hypothetical protein